MRAPPTKNKPAGRSSAAVNRPIGGGVLILNGPNLNLLGTREPEIYGNVTLADIELICFASAKKHGLTIEFRQTNHEGVLIDWIQAANKSFDGIIINAAGFTHTSIALMDALLACGLPVYEVHLSNIYRREDFRHHSYVSLAATGVICGLGATGYALALQAFASAFQGKNP